MAEKRRRSGSNCVVVGCQNNEGLDKCRGIKFYRFPAGEERCEVWIRRINRRGSDGKLWRPSAHNRICSEHFLGGEKSNDKSSPSFHPSLFPTQHVKPNTVADASRYKRITERRKRKEGVVQSVLDAATEVPETVPEESAMEMDQTFCEVGVQTDFQTEVPATFTFEMEIHSSTEKATTAKVPPPPSSLVTTEVQTAVPSLTTCEVQTNIQGATDPCVSFLTYNDKQFKSITGVTKNFFEYVSFKVGDGIRDSHAMSKNSKLLLFFMKMKLNVSFVVLGALFSVSQATARRTFYSTVDVVHVIAETFVIWFDRATIQARMPASFRAHFPDTRVIIDATEIECQRPGTQRKRILMWSQYKSRWTVKFLVGIAPSGEFTFVSDGFGGRTTDTELTNQCGILKLLEPRDIVLADKGFPHVENRIVESGAVLVMPPFRSGDRQFSSVQNRDCYEIARVRIHVERAIARLKYFEILNFVPSHMLPHIDKVFVIAAFCTNFFNDLINETNTD